MVFILNKDFSFDGDQILRKNLMTNYSNDNCEEYQKCSSKQKYNNNELTQRKPKQNKESCELPRKPEINVYQKDQNSNKGKEILINDNSNMNESINMQNNSTINYQSPSTLLETNEPGDNDCYKLQGEFRRRGWNLAGANILAVSCWIAKSQFLYARPRLTGLDFIIAAIITTACGIFARYDHVSTNDIILIRHTQ